jgi:hypothetical protein
MDKFSDNFVKSLLKFIVFAIAFYNFVWIIWQNKNHFSACVICPWYITDSFPIEAFLLLIASYLLFIGRFWSYTISVLTSGYFAVLWTWMFIKWCWTTDYSLSYRLEIITSSYFGNPFEVWESQIVIALTIFALAIYGLKTNKMAQSMS